MFTLAPASLPRAAWRRFDGTAPRPMSSGPVPGMYTRPRDANGPPRPELRRSTMNRIIVIQFITLDGVIEDPDGSAGSPDGGWAFRFGPEAVAGDKFKLGSRLDTGALLFGRATWQLFAKLWPGRSDKFSTQMNTAPKWVGVPHAGRRQRLEQLPADRGRADRRGSAAAGRTGRHRHRQHERGAHADGARPRGRVPAADLPDRARSRRSAVHRSGSGRRSAPYLGRAERRGRPAAL